MPTHYRTRLTFLLLAAWFCLLAGCVDSQLTFQIRFDELSGLQQGNRVLFQGNHVGEVTQVSYTEKGDYLVTVAILPEFTNATTRDSTFFIGSDPDKSPARAVLVAQEKPGGTVITKGAIVSGIPKTGYFDDLIQDLREKAETAETEFRKSLKDWEESLSRQSRELNQNLDKTLQELSQQFDAIKNEVQKVPDRQEVKELEKNIKEFVEDFNNAQKDVQDKLKNDVIPQLKMELEKLREQLKQEGREQEMEKIDEQMNEGIMI